MDDIWGLQLVVLDFYQIRYGRQTQKSCTGGLLNPLFPQRN